MNSTEAKELRDKILDSTIELELNPDLTSVMELMVLLDHFAKR